MVVDKKVLGFKLELIRAQSSINNLRKISSEISMLSVPDDDRAGYDSIMKVCTEHLESIYFLVSQVVENEEKKVLKESLQTASEREVLEVAVELFKEMEGRDRKPVDATEFVKVFVTTGLVTESRAQSVLQSLNRNGIIYEVKPGFFRKL